MIIGPESQHTTSGGEAAGSGPLARLVEDPVKVMRIGTSLLHLLDEVHNGPLDEQPGHAWRKSTNRLSKNSRTASRPVRQRNSSGCGSR